MTKPSIRDFIEQAAAARDTLEYIISQAEWNHDARLRGNYDFSKIAKKWGVSVDEIYRRLSEAQTTLNECQREIAARTPDPTPKSGWGYHPPSSSSSSRDRDRDDDDHAGIAFTAFLAGGCF